MLLNSSWRLIRLEELYIFGLGLSFLVSRMPMFVLIGLESISWSLKLNFSLLLSWGSWRWVLILEWSPELAKLKVNLGSRVSSILSSLSLVCWDWYFNWDPDLLSYFCRFNFGGKALFLRLLLGWILYSGRILILSALSSVCLENFGSSKGGYSNYWGLTFTRICFLAWRSLCEKITFLNLLP